MHAWLDHYSQESPTIYSFYFRTEKTLRFIPGQFIEITLAIENPDNRGVKHWFTISSTPDDPLVRITTKIVADCSSFKQALLNLSDGDRVHISEPMGDFVLPKDATIPLIFVAGGIGLTPYVSMITALQQQRETRDIRMLIALQSEDDIVFQDVFAAQHIKPIYVIANPSDAWSGERGRLTADHILALSHPNKQSLIYLAGPEPMIESLTHDLEKKHVSKSHLITDYFPGYPID